MKKGTGAVHLSLEMSVSHRGGESGGPQRGSKSIRPRCTDEGLRNHRLLQSAGPNGLAEAIPPESAAEAGVSKELRHAVPCQCRRNRVILHRLRQPAAGQQAGERPITYCADER